MRARRRDAGWPGEHATRLIAPQVLVAEDDPRMRSMVAEALRADGYDVTELPDGNALSAHLARVGGDALHPWPDLLISDVRMPGLSGMAVLETLRHADWALPVILMTAFGDPETHAEARRLGAAAVLDKPLDIDDLLTVAFHWAPPARRP